MTVAGVTAILGYGRFGGAVAELLADAGLEARAWDPVAPVPAEIRAGSPSQLVAGAARVILAVPVHALRQAALDLLPQLGRDTLVVDVSSVKVRPVRDLTTVLGGAVPWVATHPLFGPTSIALGERPLSVVVCPNPLHPSAAPAGREFWERLGCEVVEQDAAEHDRLMARTHALAFFVAKGFIDLGVEEGLPFAPPSFRAIARTIEAVRSDASHLLRTIESDNPFSGEAREGLLAALESIHRALEKEPGSGADEPALAIPDLGSRAPELREARDLIDDTDREIVRLLARREQLARRAWRVKAAAGRPVRDPERERALLDARRGWAQAEALDPEGVEEIFRRVLRASRAAQSEDGGR